MKYCQRCILPDTRPNLVIGDDGLCNACRNHGTKPSIDWAGREQAFRNVVARARELGSQYDCVVPVSGGKDSTWQVIKCLEYGLKPLAVTWRPPSRTAIGQRNLDNLIALGVHHIDFSISPAVERRFVLRAFEQLGAPALPMHMAIYNIPLEIAVRFDIPLVVYGEDSGFEYGAPADVQTGFRVDAAWKKRFGVTHGTTASDWLADDLTAKDLAPYFGPSDADLDKKGVNAVFLGYYFQWDPLETARVAIENGFETRAEGAKTGLYDFADIDDDFISIHHWLKWYKFGFTRTWDNLSLEIRNGRLTRDEAIAILTRRGDETPHQDIAKFCAFLGITTERFFEIAEKFRNPAVWKEAEGHKSIPGFLINGWSWN